MTAKARFIEGDWHRACMEALIGDTYSVFTPQSDDTVSRFCRCESADADVFEGVNTNFPAKEVFFPMTETLLNYKIAQGADDVATPEIVEQRLAVLGCRPCDAASLAVLDTVFNWDYTDTLYNSRRRQSLILSVGCLQSDQHCFCTTLGLAPDSTQGSDWLIQAVGDAGAIVTICSEKGADFAKAHASMLTDVPDGMQATVPDVPVKMDVDAIKPWLDEHFDDPFWEDVALACLGCGACSYLCPTCHCFDIVDEGNWQGGERRRNYDCCSYALFTRHASGHNPRPTQASRCRNRLMHKFKYFPERFDQRACVGCGRCARTCGASQNIVSILDHIASQPEVPASAESSS